MKLLRFYLLLAFSFAAQVGFAQGLNNGTTLTNNNRSRGTNPYADITAFGGKAVGVSAFPKTTATCTTGRSATTIYLDSAVFNNGDGITIRGCGAPNSMSTPGAPTSVTPILAIASAIPDAPYTQQVSSPTGKSAYIYAIVARDQYGALTKPSATTKITNGLTSLGLKTLAVLTLTRSNNTITVTTTGTQDLAVGGLVHAYGSSNAQFSGWYNVSTVNNSGNTFTIANTSLDTRQGSASSATGGMVSYYNGNQILWTAVAGAWEYYICGERPGDSSLKLIGTSAPTGQTGGEYTITSFYDFGETTNGSQTYPPYVTNSVCATPSATNDPLTTTVVSGGGTTSIVVAKGATSPASGATAVYDAAPAIKAAADSIAANSLAHTYTGGSIYLPPTTDVGQFYGYPINSYLKIPGGVNIIQSGSLLVNETVELPSNTNWDGGWTSTNAAGGASAFGSWAVTACSASPCIYSNNTSAALYQHMTIVSGGTNGGTIWLADDAYNLSWRDVSMDTNSNASTDYTGRAMLLRSTQSGGDLYHFDHVSFSGGPGQSNDASWSPLIYLPVSMLKSQRPTVNNSLLDMRSVFFNRRGVEWDLAGGAYNLNVDWLYRQGGITPLFTLFNGSGAPGGVVNIVHSLQDTETQPTLAGLNSGGFLNVVYVNLTQIEEYSSEKGGVPTAVSGQLPYAVTYNESYLTYTNGRGVEIRDVNGLTDANLNFIYSLNCTEGTAPSGISGRDLLYCDSTTHRFKKMENNGVVFNVAGTLSGTTGNIGGSALTAGQCASGTVSVTGATTSMSVSVSPRTYAGDGFIPWGYVSTGGTVTVKVCAEASGTPTSSIYEVRVIQ